MSIAERHSRRRNRPGSVQSRTCSRDYQRNLVVVDYPCSSPPSVHDYDKVFDGPFHFSSSMSEDEVRHEIVSLVRQKKSMFHNFDDLNEDDFVFVKCANRRVRIPDGEVMYSGESLKNIYKSGSVYVRLTRSFSKLKVSYYE